MTKNSLNISYIILIRNKINLSYTIPITTPRKRVLLQVQATNVFGVLGLCKGRPGNSKGRSFLAPEVVKRVRILLELTITMGIPVCVHGEIS